jgi:hypothetical protein
VMVFKRYHFKDGTRRRGACLDRVLDYYDLKRTRKTKRLKDLFLILDDNGVEYSVHPYRPEDPLDKDLVGLWVFDFDKVYHVGVIDRGHYYDSYPHTHMKRPFLEVRFKNMG